MAVTADGAGTAAEETVMVPPVQGVPKIGPRPEKRFLNCRLAAPQNKRVKKPAGLKTGWRQDCLALARCSAAVSQTARHDICFCAGLEVADEDDLVPRPDPDNEVPGSTPQDCVGAVL